MAEENTDNKPCPSCGAIVRNRALFCFKCGGSIAAKKDSVSTRKLKQKLEDAIGSMPEEPKVSDAWFKGSLFDKQVEEQPAEVEISREKIEEIADEKPAQIEKKPKLKTAASMRQKAKTIQRPQVEMVWQPNSGGSNIIFILATILFCLLAGGVLFGAWYLR